jgi:hypothetical protein
MSRMHEHGPGEPQNPVAETTHAPDDSQPPEQGIGAGGDTLDFFGASPPPTLPVPVTPAPGARPLATEAAPGPMPPTQAPVAPPPPAAAPDKAAIRRGIRVRTIVFGLVMLVISGTSLVSLLTGARVDAGVVVLGVLIGAGAALLIGGLSAAVRDIRQGGTRFT